MGKFVKGTVKLFILVVMISPVIGWVKSGKLDFSAASEIGEDEAYYAACCGKLEQADEAEISAFLKDSFSVTAEIRVKRESLPPFSREKIKILVTDPGIIGEDERIHIVTDIREAVKARYGAETEVS